MYKEVHMITVAMDGSGDFTSIQEAVNAASVFPETIFIKNGIYHERVEVDKPHITFEGENAENTILECDFYANMLMEDGSKRGTFRSYTLLINCDYFTCSNITIANTAGFGHDVGQALAVYAEGDRIVFDGCRLLGHQDTLFTGPLPKEPAKPGGFTGKTEFAPRRVGRQLYRNCYIEGEVDFIFGSAVAYFEDCELHSLDRHMEVNGYVTAASTYEGEKYGYVFHNCHFTSNCPKETVYLGRPWRVNAKTVLIDCILDDHIKREGFHDWDKEEARDKVFYAEYNSVTSSGACKDRASFVKALSKQEAAEYTFEKVWNYQPLNL
jgi:pectinesterase